MVDWLTETYRRSEDATHLTDGLSMGLMAIHCVFLGNEVGVLSKKIRHCLATIIAARFGQLAANNHREARTRQILILSAVSEMLI